MQTDLAPTIVGTETLLRVAGLSKRYTQGGWLSRTRVRALRDVDLILRSGSTLALIGASGSGKSTLARCLACLEMPDAGEIWFAGRNLAALTQRELVPFRRQIQMIFQDPTGSLNPRLNAVEIVSEPLLIVGCTTKQQRLERALELMEVVGLSPDWGKRLPYQFSAGQRRRLAIARALALEPKVLILDEALTGLDLSIQAQISNLLLDLQAAHSLTYICISHDLNLVAHLADEVAVLHQGQVVETAGTTALLQNPRSLPADALLGAATELSRFARNAQ